MTRIAMYPATLDPIHNGHIDIAVRAAKIFDKIIVAVYDVPKKKLLFDVETRVRLAEQAFKYYDNIEVAQYSGLTVNYAQSIGAMAIIRGLRVFSDFEYEFRMSIANRTLTPEIETVAMIADESQLHISSTTIREIAELGGDVSSMVPAYVKEALIARFAELQDNPNSPGYTVSIRD